MVSPDLLPVAGVPARLFRKTKTKMICCSQNKLQQLGFFYKNQNKQKCLRSEFPDHKDSTGVKACKQVGKYKHERSLGDVVFQRTRI